MFFFLSNNIIRIFAALEYFSTSRLCTDVRITVTLSTIKRRLLGAGLRVRRRFRHSLLRERERAAKKVFCIFYARDYIVY